jgi:hypothetical protein
LEKEFPRFWSRVKIIKNCWEWTGSRHRQGYGRVGYLGNRAAYTHRVSYQLVNGKIKKGLNVLHRCDNPPCVNPDHLFLGTQSDNAYDMFSKNRGNRARGEKNSKARLIDSQVRRVKYGSEPLASLAREFSVTYQTLHYIRGGKTWKHI